jgi:hypothetical protein
MDRWKTQSTRDEPWNIVWGIKYDRNFLDSPTGDAAISTSGAVAGSENQQVRK